MSNFSIASAVSVSIGIILIMAMISESEDCSFSVESVNIICGSNDNISEKALYVIVGAFFIVLGFVLYKKHNEQENAF